MDAFLPAAGTRKQLEDFLFIDELERMRYIERKSQVVKLEKHFCSKCNIDQPVRSKHCKSCDACIATFDHHCIWVGNCIGEKNRALFMVYLVL